MGHTRRLPKIKKRKVTVRTATIPCVGNCGGLGGAARTFIPCASSSSSSAASSKSGSKCSTPTSSSMPRDLQYECNLFQEQFLKKAQQQRILENRKCAVCETRKDLAFCAKCHKVSYCSKEHQAKDWKEHKRDCFPFTEVSQEEEVDYCKFTLKGPLGCGPYLRASRDITKLTFIFQESPLMTGPGCGLNRDYEPLCLGCTKPIGDNKCSKCNWPVCGLKCEKDNRHSEYECEIFSTNKVKELFQPFQYELVRILRCLLLKTKDPSTYEELIDLDGALDQRRTLECLVEATTTACIFINKNCKLTEFDRDIIDEICGIVDLQTQVSGPFRTTMQIFSFPSKLAHSCSPNCRFIDVVRKNGENLLMLLPIKDITEGSLLTRCLLENPVLPIYRRQLFYKEMYYYTCTCLLCRDPTENETFFSGVKCTKFNRDVKKKCGYLIPKSPTDLSTPWICTTCKVEKDGDELYAFLNGYDRVDAAFRNKMKDLCPEDIVKYTRERIKNLESRLHPNNYIVVMTKLFLQSKLREYLLSIGMDKSNESMELVTELYEECERIGNNLLKVVQNLRVQALLTKGLILYHLAASRWAYMGWAIAFGFGKIHDSEKQAFVTDFNDIVTKAVKILDFEYPYTRHLIDQLIFMKQNLDQALPTGSSKPTTKSEVSKL